MTAAVDIANRALSAIAAKSTITNFELEQSVEAKQVRLLYASTRDALLRAAHWNFAKRATYLSLLKAAPGTPENATGSGPWNPDTMPAPPWLYEYAYPSDAVLVRFVAPQPPASGDTSTPIFSTTIGGPMPTPMAMPVRFEVASGQDTTGRAINVVNCNAQSAVGTYTLRVETEELWDASFQEAMVQALASRLAMPLTGNVDLAKSTAQQAMSVLLTARTRDGNEGLTKNDHVPDWIAARGHFSAMPTESYVTPWVQPSFLVF